MKLKKGIKRIFKRIRKKCFKYDFSDLTEKEKEKVLRDFGEMSGKYFLTLFIALKLESKMEWMLVNDATNGEYILSFKKII